MASIRKIENKKGISYKVEVSLGYDSSGKKLRQTATFVPDPNMTKKQQEKALQKFAAEFEEKAKNGNRIDGDKVSLKDFTEEWFKTYAENNLERTMLHRYHYVLDTQILPALGHMKLSKIKPYHIEKFFVALSKDGARTDGEPGGYSHESIRKCKTILSSILSTAEKWEVIENNPCRKAGLPKQEQPEETVKAYTLDQTRRFLEFAEEDYRKRKEKHPNYGNVIPFANSVSTDISKLQTLAIINLGIFGGLRRGEMVGLDWDSLDFEKNTIKVKQSAAYADGEQFVKTPKSKCSIRTISFPQPVMDIFRELQKEQEVYRRGIGDKWTGTEDCVFIKQSGERMCISTPYNNYQRLLKRFNKTLPEDMKLPVLSLHDLRHTNASLLIRSNKVDIVSVSKKLGHRDSTITSKYYLHSFEEAEQETAEILEDMLLENTEKVAK